jgi:hypothetical protein
VASSSSWRRTRTADGRRQSSTASPTIREPIPIPFLDRLSVHFIWILRVAAQTLFCRFPELGLLPNRSWKTIFLFNCGAEYLLASWFLHGNRESRPQSPGSWSDDEQPLPYRLGKGCRELSHCGFRRRMGKQDSSVAAGFCKRGNLRKHDRNPTTMTSRRSAILHTRPASG